MPAITFCPFQALDELHHASILFNRFIEHRCVEEDKDSSSSPLALPQCDDAGVEFLAGQDSPFYSFLGQLKVLFRHWAMTVDELMQLQGTRVLFRTLAHLGNIS